VSRDYADYAGKKGVNWSRLKLARTSALHYRDTPPRKDTGSLGMLRAVHALVLEPENFDRDFAVYEGKTRRGKAWDAFQIEHEGRTILNTREHGEAETIAAAVLAYLPAGILLEHDGASTEVGLYWSDRISGTECKGRADLVILVDGEAWVVDLKTVRSVNPRQMATDAARMGYHGQLAHYADGVAALHGVPVTRWGLLCVEGTAPHDVALYWLDDEARHAGKGLRDRLLHTVTVARVSGDYPGQCPTSAPLSLPSWALDDAFTDTFTGSGS
jgi:hypothetical protein